MVGFLTVRGWLAAVNQSNGGMAGFSASKEWHASAQGSIRMARTLNARWCLGLSHRAPLGPTNVLSASHPVIVSNLVHRHEILRCRPLHAQIGFFQRYHCVRINTVR